MDTRKACLQEISDLKKLPNTLTAWNQHFKNIHVNPDLIEYYFSDSPPEYIKLYFNCKRFKYFFPGIDIELPWQFYCLSQHVKKLKSFIEDHRDWPAIYDTKNIKLLHYLAFVGDYVNFVLAIERVREMAPGVLLDLIEGNTEYHNNLMHFARLSRSDQIIQLTEKLIKSENRSYLLESKDMFERNFLHYVSLLSGAQETILSNNQPDTQKHFVLKAELKQLAPLSMDVISIMSNNPYDSFNNIKPLAPSLPDIINTTAKPCDLPSINLLHLIKNNHFKVQEPTAPNIGSDQDSDDLIEITSSPPKSSIKM